MADLIPIDPHTFGADQQCFGCGPANPSGLHLRFFREGDEVVTTFTPGPELTGPPGVLHGGLSATIADEVAAWALIALKGRMGFTTALSVRYLRPLRLGQPVEARAHIGSEHGATVTLKIELLQGGVLGATARATYALPSAEAAARILGLPVDPEMAKLFGG